MLPSGCALRACGTVYCSKCIQAGPPFKTRRENLKGLIFPKVNARLFPNYICEACQVRAHLGRELKRDQYDFHLLMLERMRQLDTMNEWAEGTLTKYGHKIERFFDFETQFGISPLVPTKLKHPPLTPAIPIIWTQLRASLEPGKSKGSTLTYGTTRSLRSAAAFYYSWDMQQCYPGQVAKIQKRHFFSPYVPPSEELVATVQAGGMARRMGDHPQASWALQFVHVKFVNDQLERAYQVAPTYSAKREIANAGAANVLSWLAATRGGETFSLQRDWMKVTRPEEGPSLGLPLGIGVIEGRLSAETKSSPNKVAEITIAYECASGLEPGKWLERLLAFPDTHGNNMLFSSDEQAVWDSRYFRHNYLWPLLEVQRLMGEPTLKAFNTTEGQRIKDKIWSMHSYRRGLTVGCRDLLV